MHLAAREAVLLVARTIACLQLRNAKGEGVKIDMAANFGLTVLPKETVLVKSTMRGMQVRSLVENAAQGSAVDRAEGHHDAAEAAE
ncbi:hypothetical protein AMAG_19823 [Allomyces macrogynus ATCC 38327]|uniref:Uncharacterized protein n=1 Tax=Allomyces macrogynus (strain ATCC 38327) TaxID=578462 RepID=A0A0L0SZR5_ALLM3|nr:hypothetical protein AMAG_19823 [Allomyces macrogynus ATCC 38327]|eukprot:KNE67966.1 hypothetical protein AMAG_19823 [Allomyces macrogynus ATCC 38327]